jgi:hypothetical protein
MPDRRTILTGMVSLPLLPHAAWSHHGWAWAEDVEFTLSGTITRARLGNPHGELEVATGDGDWIAEIGQPWRNERAGLTEEKLAPGTPVTLEGHRSRDADERVMKAERVIVAGETHDLDPDRS